MARIKNLPVNPERKEATKMADENYSKLILSDEKGNKYTLEFNSRVVKNMERKGFKIDTDYPNMMIDELFLGAFQMHHKGITPERAREIWKHQRKKDDLLGVLVKLYMKPLEDLMAEDEDEDDNDSPTWETV